MKITVFRFGTTLLGENCIFANGDKNKSRRISLLYVLLENNGKKYLVDAGCDTMPGFELLEHIRPYDLLQKYGYTKDDIDGVILSHCHFDHVDCARYYNNSTVYIHESEVNEVKKYITSNKIQTFQDELCIDGRIRIKHSGGHCKGSSVVEIKTPETIFVLCGDETYHTDCFASPQNSGGVCNREKSLAFFAEYSKEKYTVILAHDATVVENVGAKVIYED